MNNDNMREYSLPFAAWELRLYLDTHPNDAAALAKYKALCAAADDKCNYACHTNSRSAGNDSGCGCEKRELGRQRMSGCGCERNMNTCHNVWSWIDGPWPWEVEANNVGGNC